MKSSETDVKDSLQNHPKHFDRKKNASAYTLPKKNLTKVFNYYQKKANSESKLHTYVQNSRKMCALSAGACYFGKKQKVFKIVMLWKDCMSIHSIYVIRNKSKGSKVIISDF